MLAKLSSLNAHSFPIFQPILMILVSIFMVHRALSDKTYLSLGLLSPLTFSVPLTLKAPITRKVVQFVICVDPDHVAYNMDPHCLSLYLH